MANVIEVVVRTTDHTREGMESANRRAGKLRESFKSVRQNAANMFAVNVVGAGVAAFKGFMSGATESASNLGESINAVQQIFGSSARTILSWGEQNAESFGLSKQAFNELATPMGAMLKNAGLSLQDTSKWTIDLTKRASDMASVFNTSVPEALEAIQAGLRGESDPLERFGVGLSAAKVEAEALAATGKTSAKSLTDQEKATARLNLIMKQTEATAGDFRNTSDGLANGQRIQQARMENLRAEIGQKLLPAKLALGKVEAALAGIIATHVLPVLNKLAKWFSEHPAAAKAAAVIVGTVLVAAFLAWAAAAAAAAAATIAATWPILAIIAAIVAVGAAFAYAYTHSETFRKIVQVTIAAVAAAFHWLVSVIGAVVSWIADNWRRIPSIIITPFRVAISFVGKVLSGFVSLIGRVIGWIGDHWKQILSIILLPFTIAFSGITTVLSSIITLIIKIVGGIRSHWSAIVSIVTTPFRVAISWVITQFMAFLAFIGRVVGWIHNQWNRFYGIVTAPVRSAVNYIVTQWSRLWQTASSAFRTVVSFFTGLPSRISGAVGNLRKLLMQKGRDVIQGLWDGLTEIWRKVTGWISGLGGWIKAHKGPIDLDRSLLTPAGKALMNGLWDGLKSGAGPIGKWLQQFTGGISGFIGAHFGSGVERWRSVALQALAYTGSPASWIGSLLRRMNQESGGNQFAINNWDSNAARGDPSRGLMQTIGATFRAYARELAGRGIYDPFANIVASIRYANAAYGSAPRGWNRPGGYDQGGWLLPGTTLATNLTNRPEAVLTQQQLDQMGGATRVILEVQSTGGRFEDMFAEMIRRYVRVRGGNVQVVFGGR